MTFVFLALKPGTVRTHNVLGYNIIHHQHKSSLMSCWFCSHFSKPYVQKLTAFSCYSKVTWTKRDVDVLSFIEWGHHFGVLYRQFLSWTVFLPIIISHLTNNNTSISTSLSKQLTQSYGHNNKKSISFFICSNLSSSSCFHPLN